MTSHTIHLPAPALAFAAPTMAEVLARAGVEAINTDIVRKHKAAELATTPPATPGWWWKIPIFGSPSGVGITVMSLAFASWVSVTTGFFFVESFFFKQSLFLLAGILIGLVLCVSNAMNRFDKHLCISPARWSRRRIGVKELLDMKLPSAIENRVERVASALPGVQFEIDELKQDKVILDPVIYATTGWGLFTQRIAFGIWKGNVLIR